MGLAVPYVREYRLYPGVKQCLLRGDAIMQVVGWKPNVNVDYIR